MRSSIERLSSRDLDPQAREPRRLRLLEHDPKVLKAPAEIDPTFDAGRDVEMDRLGEELPGHGQIVDVERDLAKTRWSYHCHPSQFVDDHITSKPEKAGVVVHDDQDWQQPESHAAYFIGKLCHEGATVLDPMCGSGTTLVAARHLNRKWIGMDIDPVCVQASRERLS